MKRISASRFTANLSATSAVEFAILSPIFLLLLLGMLAYGIYFGASHSVQQIAADSARAAVAGLTAAERKTIVSTYIENNATGYALVDAGKLTVSADDDPARDGEFTVAVSYDAADLPIWNLFDRLPLPHMTIVRRSVIRIGGL